MKMVDDLDDKYSEERDKRLQRVEAQVLRVEELAERVASENRMLRAKLRNLEERAKREVAADGEKEQGE